MNAKKLFLIFMALLWTTPYALADQTTITGTARCIMPDVFEFKSQAADQTQEIQPPLPLGAEERLLQTEENKTLKATNGKKTQILVYTICAK